ncbi:hypothetical protein KM176_12485 [Pseudooceanicola sp. CBS1P-1]|uniref:Uncharacterized protein n=1 Tax=Pseudooceanicola albus TaxID=2692189 RepID=A0A6L7G391_9RHOB|nr:MULTISPECIES: hypothetical protein [Pseudooceanicola]MBT9384678.1 hypothetical protein [Pseudooceanicola endophyticus]MXN18379.1 hypothetical protein [Pseudooceanicola albus]
MKTELLSPAQAAEHIRAGIPLIAAGSEAALRQLPPGNWIGGTSHYFLTEEGGRRDDRNVLCTLFDMAEETRLRFLPTAELPDLAVGRFPGGLSVILIPAFSPAHTEFALGGPGYPGLFDQPLMGWISGVPLEDIGKITPKVFDGTTGEAFEDGAVLMHVALPADRRPEIDIVNLFSQDSDPARSFRFSETGFSARTATVEGREVALADYIITQGLDTRLPLVADYAGAMINVSVRTIDEASGEVHFYAPVVAGVDYCLARPIGDYTREFLARASGDGTGQLSCNCILNYLYGALEGQKTGSFTGPATFGEIAYMLLNQTMVKLDLAQAESAAVA